MERLAKWLSVVLMLLVVQLLCDSPRKLLTRHELIQNTARATVVVASLKEGTLSTGVLVDSRGYILTCYHSVIDVRIPKQVMFTDDDTVYKAKVVAYKPKFDLAILKLINYHRNIPPIQFAPRSTFAEYWNIIGDDVVIVGHPLGLFWTASEGIISRLSQVSSKRNRYMFVLQTTAPINAGNSGGPVVDQDGRIVGIVRSHMYRADNLGFLIPGFYGKWLLSTVTSSRN